MGTAGVGAGRGGYVQVASLPEVHVSLSQLRVRLPSESFEAAVVSAVRLARGACWAADSSGM